MKYLPVDRLLDACDEADAQHEGQMTALQIRLLASLYAKPADEIAFDTWVEAASKQEGNES
jgi:hypothetical protein